MRFPRTVIMVLIFAGFGAAPAGGTEEEPAPKAPATAQVPSELGTDSPAPPPTVGEGRGARKKPASRSFRPSVDVPAGDAVSFPVDI